MSLCLSEDIVNNPEVAPNKSIQVHDSLEQTAKLFLNNIITADNSVQGRRAL